jgi:hypothetical protein
MITYSKLGNFGRLGNMLFQIAATIGIATKNNINYTFPPWSYSKHFKNPIPQSKINFVTHTYAEPNSHYSDTILTTKYNWDLKGYFQSWKYFDHCKDLIEHYFTPNFDIKGLFGDVAIHVRRGDYLGIQHIHPILDMSYYIEAMQHFPDSTFVIFSDDINWCEKNFPQNDCVFMPPKTDVYDLFHMSKYPNQIIANSSFSWWAAWLNKNPKKIIIAPKNYVTGETRDDRIPLDWVKI